ncbi:MAG TPA: TolC family protein [Candidatus Dependentiae bacterium]|nr:TolC family protein [Candidatus Dependentiae bacterium]
MAIKNKRDTHYVLVSLMAVFTVYGAEAQQRPLSIFTAAETGYTNRADLKKIWRDIRASKELEKSAIAGYLPHIQVEAGAGKASRFATLYFTQLLYSPAGPLQLYRIAQQDTRVLELQQILHKETIRFQAETGVLDLWYSQQKNQLVQEYNCVSRLVYAQQDHEYSLGLSDKETWMQKTADFTLAQARVAKYIDELTVSSAKVELNLGIMCTPSMHIDSESVKSLIDHALQEGDAQSAERYYQLALENRQELRIADELIKKEIKWQHYYAKSYFPSISLYTNVIKYSFNGGLQVEGLGAMGTSLSKLFTFRTGWNAGFKFDWQFDGLENMFNSCASEERGYSAMMDRIDKIVKIKEEVENNHARLSSLCKEFRVSKADYTRAANEIILKRKQYEVGLISAVDLKQAETVWLKAQYDYLTSKVNVAKQYQRLLYSCGYPDNPQKIMAQGS